VGVAPSSEQELHPVSGREALALSVLVPLADARGDAVDHLRTWTHEQTLPRERYQLVIASPGDNPEVEEQVAGILAPHDRLERVSPDSNVFALWHAAATHADTPWLLLTENHCEADPACLQTVVEALEADPDVDALSMEHGHISENRTGQLAERWFDAVYEDWDRSDRWTSQSRLNPVGFVINRRTYDQAGGIIERYDDFSLALLSARLHELGARIEHVPAQVLHVHVDDIKDHHQHSAGYAFGECVARATEDPEFLEHYFGHGTVLRNRIRYRPEVARRAAAVVADSAARALLRRRQELRWLLRELATRLPACAAGTAPYIAWERLAFRATEYAATHLPLSPQGRWWSYLRAQEGVVRLTHLRWIAEHPEPLTRPTYVSGVRPIEDLGPHELAPVHTLERNDGRAFRWTEPVTQLRLRLPESDADVRLDTGGLRAPVLHYVRGVYANSRRVEPAVLREEDGALVIPVPSHARRNGGLDLTIIARPLEPASSGPVDPRRLGLPLFSVEVRPSEPSS
jgi:hypothetical protein